MQPSFFKLQAVVHNSAPAVHKKVIAPVVVAKPVVAAYAGHGHGHGGFAGAGFGY